MKEAPKDKVKSKYEDIDHQANPLNSMESHAAQTKENWKILAGFSGVYTGIAVASIPLDVVTLGITSPITVLASGMAIESGRQSKKNYDASKIINNGFEGANEQHIKVADEIVNRAFRDSGLIPVGKAWYDVVDIKKSSKVYDGTLEYVKTIPKSEIGSKKETMVKILASHLKDNESHKSDFKKSFKAGGGDHISFKTKKVNNLFEVFEAGFRNEQMVFKDLKSDQSEVSSDDGVDKKPIIIKPQKTSFSERVLEQTNINKKDLSAPSKNNGDNKKPEPNFQFKQPPAPSRPHARS
jgi:hypothetical protein